MGHWTCENLQAIIGGRWLVAPRAPSTPLAGVSIDTRTIQPGEAFVAIRGQRLDGHQFLDQARAAGAALLVAERAPGPADKVPLLLVADTLAALHALTAAHRRRLAEAGTTVLAVGGSNGKTTTRHLIHAVLAACWRGTQSPSSFNNHIGVPLTMLAADPTDRFVVVEIGTNHPGEMDAISGLVQPDAAVLTSVGQEHLAHFGDLAGVLREEAALLRHVRPGGPAFLPGRVRASLQGAGLLHGAVPLVTYGRRDECGCTHTWDQRRISADGQRQSFVIDGGLPIDMALPGEHSVDNATAAFAVGRWMGVADREIAAALAAVAAVPMRMQVQRLGDPTRPDRQLVLLNDCYNANADSMSAALAALAEFPRPGAEGRRVAVLGDMLELGDAGPRCHQGLARSLTNAEDAASRAGVGPPEPRRPVDQAVFIGPLSLLAAEVLGGRWTADRIVAFPRWQADLGPTVAGLLRPGDVVLLKASRGMGLERLIPDIERRFATR